MATSNRQQTIVASVGLGLRLLGPIVQGIETLFGKKTGQTKKQAAMLLFNAAAFGAAAGFGLSGDTEVSSAIETFAPAASATIDSLAAEFFPDHSDAPQPEIPALPTQPVQNQPSDTTAGPVLISVRPPDRL